METKIMKDSRIRKELLLHDKTFHDTYYGLFICKCTKDTICKEFINCFSKFEMKNYMDLIHLTQEQREWILNILSTQSD